MDMPTYEELFKQIKFNFRLFGIPYNERKLSISFYVLLITFIFIMIEECSYLIYKTSGDFLRLIEILTYFSNGVLSLLKILPIALKREKIFELTDALDQLYDKIMSSDQNRKLVRSNVILNHVLMKYFFILNVILVSLLNFSPLVYMCYDYLSNNNITFILPYAVALPFCTDWWLTWFIVYVHSISCGYISVLHYTTVDVLYCVLTSHICNHFAIISNEIIHLDVNNTNDLSQIVKSHQYIIKLSEDLEDIFSLPNLFKILIGSLQICSLGFSAIMGEWARIPGCILFLLSVVLQILMMSMFGENIITESQRVGEAACACKWYDMNQESKKSILTIMIRSHKQTQLTAYNFSVISSRSFTKIMSTSWSYFTLLKTVYNTPETQVL